MLTLVLVVEIDGDGSSSESEFACGERGGGEVSDLFLLLVPPYVGDPNALNQCNAMMYGSRRSMLPATMSSLIDCHLDQNHKL